MNTIIQTEIKGDDWIATTPHAPSLKAKAASESDALNLLVAEIRKQIRDCGDEGVDWMSDATGGMDDNKITRQISGCWPAVIKEPQPDNPAKRKEVTDGTN